MGPPTREQCEQTYLDLINVRRKQTYYQQQMEHSRTTPKFQEELWEYAKQVEDAVEEYKVIVWEYQLATHDMSLQTQVSTQYDKVSDAPLYMPTSEPERNTAMFKPHTLLHNGSINEFRQLEKHFSAYYQQNHIHPSGQPYYAKVFPYHLHRR